MRNLMAFVALSSFAAASTAQQVPAPAPVSAPEPVKMVKKKVCERVDNEETTGSRLGSAPKVCKIITVPASEVKEERGR
ncbi:MAG TPA: hypothetical protein VNR68_01080 [Sphingomicrobium sp.]|nr:hypothetical protein [Sphingomicrobium sp.]